MKTETTEKQREINVKSLLIRGLLRWRIFLLAILVFCLLGGGYKYYSLKKAIQPATNEPAVELSEEEQKELEYYEKLVLDLDRTVKERKEYLNTTGVMDMDALHTGMSTSTLVVRNINYTSELNNNGGIEYSDRFDLNYSVILRLLSNFVKTGIDWTELKDQLGIYEDSLFNEMVIIGLDRNIATLQTTFKDTNTSEIIMNYVLNQINTKFVQTLSEEGFKGYELKQVGSVTSSYVIFGNNLSWLTSRLNEITNLEKEKTDAENSLKKLHNKIDQEPYVAGSVNMKTVIKTGVKAGVLGFCGSIALVLVYLIYSGKVLSSKEMNEVFDLNNLGVIPEKKTSKIDQLVVKMEKENRGSLPAEVRYELIAYNIKAVSEKYATIALLGDVSGDVLRSVKENLESAKLEKRIVTIENTGVLSERRNLSEADAAIIVASVEKSRYDEIGDLLSVTQMMYIPVLGSVTV